MSGSYAHKKAVQRKAADLILLLALVALAAATGDGWRPANAAGTEPATLESFLSRHGFSAIDDRADMKIGDSNLSDVSPLDVAARQGQEQPAALLIASGADVNADNKYVMTPLHYAARQAHEKVAALLLAKGADVNASDKDGDTPCMVWPRRWRRC